MATPDELSSQARSFLEGRAKASAFVQWVHDQIGHSGAEDLQDLVELSDIWMLGASEADDAEFDSSPRTQSQREYVQEAASQIVRGLPVPPLD